MKKKINPETQKFIEMINKESKGIWPMYEAFYIESIIYTAGRSLDAFNRFDQALVTSVDAESIIVVLHEALTHSAALSRFFWPSPPQWKKELRSLSLSRGIKLQKAFNLEDSSPLNDRDLRNALEHFDEQLDEFLLQDHVGQFFPQSVIGLASLKDEPLINIFRLVDPREEVFVLLGQQYSFGPIRKIVQEVFDQAIKMSESGGRLQ